MWIESPAGLVARVAALAVISFTILVGPGRPVSACSCGPVTESQALASSDAIFVGEVTGIDDDLEFEEPFVVRFTMDVVQVFKGDAFETQSLVTPQRGGACGLEMELGESWIVYATRPGADGDEVIDDTELASGLCTASRPGDVADVSAELGGGSPPSEGVSSFSGDDDGGGVPGILFAVAFVVFGVAIAAGGTVVASRRRHRPIPDA